MKTLLVPGRIRDLDDIADLTTAMIRAFAEGDIHPGRSKEIRQWTQLLFTAVAAKNPKQDAPVNLITQLIQMETPVMDNPRTVINTVPVVVAPHSVPPTLGPAPVPLLEERLQLSSFSDADVQDARTAVLDSAELLEIE